jgi:deoxyadenosine/deoxycytidine kinase
LYGPAAVGKLTIAKRLSTEIGFHNHLIVDALTAVFPFGSEPFVRLREQFWLATIEGAISIDRSMVFTFTPEPTVSDEYPWQVKTMVEAAGGSIHFVQLTLSAEEQERRIENADRSQFRKLNSLTVLRQIRSEQEDWIASVPEPDLTIDTETVGPEEASALILSHFQRGNSA